MVGCTEDSHHLKPLLENWSHCRAQSVQHLQVFSPFVESSGNMWAA